MRQDEARRLFAEVVQPEADAAFRLALWLTGSREDAQDVVQEAALRAFRAIDTFHGPSPKAWFLTIVRRAAFTWLARNRPKDLVPTDDLEAAERAHPGAEPAFGAATPQDPEKLLLARQSRGRVEAAVAALPLRFREAILLREIEGLSYKDIAEILDVPPGTVMSRLARARAELAKTLAEERG